MRDCRKKNSRRKQIYIGFWSIFHGCILLFHYTLWSLSLLLDFLPHIRGGLRFNVRFSWRWIGYEDRVGGKSQNWNYWGLKPSPYAQPFHRPHILYPSGISFQTKRRDHRPPKSRFSSKDSDRTHDSRIVHMKVPAKAGWWNFGYLSCRKVYFYLLTPRLWDDDRLDSRTWSWNRYLGSLLVHVWDSILCRKDY